MRTVVGYIPSGYLNSAASTTPTGSVDAETQLPINTGLTLGAFVEVNDADALAWSNPNTTTYVNKLYSGTYVWAQLDPAITSSTAIGVGTPLYFLSTGSGYVVTNVQTAYTNAPDFAGVCIDPSMSGTVPYAFIQINGKVACSFDSSVAPTVGAVVNLTSGAATFAALAQGTFTVTQPTVGYALTAGAASTTQYVRITRPVVRF
jgi:hypothetical protein